MTRDGKMSNRDRDTLLKAAALLNKWCDKHDAYRDSNDYEEDFTYSSASLAAGAITNFLYQTRGE